MTTLIGIIFDFMGMTYYRTTKDISIGDTVVVTTPHGNFAGHVIKLRQPTEEEMAKPDFETLFPEIVRIATFSDLAAVRNAEKKGVAISKSTQELSNTLKLGMKVLKSYLDIDDDKVLVTFTSDARVDFRELVRILNGTYHMRIELRQIGPRDQARLVGGIGPCGLPLCCTTFLNSFDGISIAMAKNQLLSINIPKLSGQCGKLMCCLKFEDKAYAEIRPTYPKIGEKFAYNNKNYEITGLNLLTDTITTYNGDSYESFTKEEYERVKKGLTKTDETTLKFKDVNSGVDLSGHGIKDTANRIAQIERNEKKQEEASRNKLNQNNKNNRNNQNNNRPNNQNNRSNNQNSNRPNNNQNNNNRPQNNNQNNQQKNNQQQNQQRNNQQRNNQQHQQQNNQQRQQNNNRPNNNQNNRNNNQNNNRPQNNNQNNNRPNNQNNNRSFNGKNNHSYNGNRNNNRPQNNKPAGSSSGFIPVSQISDKSVLDVKPVTKDDQK